MDPARIAAPTIVMRGQYDGIASLEDLLDFFARLPNPDKQFAVIPGIAHASFHHRSASPKATIVFQPGSWPSRATAAPAA